LDFISASKLVDFLSNELLFGQRLVFDRSQMDFLVGVNRLRVGVPNSDFYSLGWRFRTEMFEPLNEWLSLFTFLQGPKFMQLKLTAYPLGVNARIDRSSSYTIQWLAQMQLTQQWNLSAGFYSHLFKFDALGGGGEVSTGVRNSAYFAEVGILYHFK
jgi:hypothetical protein